MSRMAYITEVQIARVTAYQGDLATAEEITRRMIAAQAEAQAAGRQDLVFVEGERILLDAVDFFLRGEAAAGLDDQFDALVARGRALQLQPQDIVELLEWKGLAAVRAGRAKDGLAFMEQARVEAKGTIAFDRVDRRIASLQTSGAAARLATG